ncbi:GDP-L-fucose synthase [Rhizobium sp. DKSPLA3]|uniref:GDP-L-fucose synthase n=1 Tax=Rhizobium quercicola TaxID=2901226 RepID=A0A9X1NUR6_9HYPH|nr:GDP-L-fucose synthase [Rhizobium quercicola]MCD7109686.1 GDP-L-fucose synthase [Rhizobium quercicola]
MTVALVTGASGMLGSALVQKLKRLKTYDVISVARADVDLLKAEDVRAFFEDVKPKIVFHCAAKVAGLGGNSAFPAEFFDENVLINTHVVQASRLAGASKFVAVSTAAIYSDTAPLPMKESDIWEGPPHSSEIAYGVAKRAMLTQLQSYKTQYGLDYGYAVLTNLYGPNDTFNMNYGHVVPSLMCKFREAISRTKNIEVWGDGTPQRDFLHVDDAAEALIHIGERGDGAFNVASGSTVTIRELVEMLAGIVEFNGEIVWNRDKPNGQLLRQYDLSSIHSLGFTPQVSLPKGLKSTWDWYINGTKE